MELILATDIDEKGREFSIVGDLQDLASNLQSYFDVDPDDEKYGINHIPKAHPYGEERFTAKERVEDELGFKSVLNYDRYDWERILHKIKRKKNGTFAKGRVLCLHRGHTFAHYWEESYGWNAPELRIKTIDDFTAKLELVQAIESY
ncbi:hypothetical protein [Bacillus subtilis]|uniref:hypothetical protein n=1 Tax=Bacillus subtilis TaxID=1423 RepID=UPI0021D93D13|nr:hypothetical protein [Bacillus subtilis]